MTTIKKENWKGLENVLNKTLSKVIETEHKTHPLHQHRIYNGKCLECGKQISC